MPEPLTAAITAALTEIKASNREFLCRWDGDQRKAILDAAEGTFNEFDGLLKPEWKALACLRNGIGKLVDHFPKTRTASRLTSDPAALELELGELVIATLVCCAAVASVLDDALNVLSGTQAAA
jgi:hypothetical protein